MRLVLGMRVAFKSPVWAGAFPCPASPEKALSSAFPLRLPIVFCFPQVGIICPRWQRGFSFGFQCFEDAGYIATFSLSESSSFLITEQFFRQLLEKLTDAILWEGLLCSVWSRAAHWEPGLPSSRPPVSRGVWWLRTSKNVAKPSYSFSGGFYLI